MGEQPGETRDGRRLGPQDAWTQRDGANKGKSAHPVKLHRIEPAFRPDQQGAGAVRSPKGWRVRTLRTEIDRAIGPPACQQFVEREQRLHHGNVEPLALLCRLGGDGP